ncbi:MAG TPA: hypothetical protein VFN55_00895 [Solirubrobacteraceae bacterium]|nr:hypothetical protein [Solirubrobacteraceae bacterium]
MSRPGLTRTLRGLAPAALALSLAACGATAKPQAGTLQAHRASHKAVDDPRKNHVSCLRQDHVPVTEFSHWWLKAGTGPGAPQVMFAPTPGAAQELQISGQVTGAEIIGAAVVYPEQGSPALLKKVETCMAKGVTG